MQVETFTEFLDRQQMRVLNYLDRQGQRIREVRRPAATETACLPKGAIDLEFSHRRGHAHGHDRNAEWREANR